VLVANGLLILAGCGARDVIRRYQVPHETPPSSPVAASVQTVPQRLLGAIVAGDGQAWFVKLLGPAERVAAVAEAYEQVVQSLRFPAEQQGPTWTCPAGWTERGADENRFATLESDGLEIAISQLPWDSTQWDAYVLANLNRWRRQVQLPPIAADELAQAGQRLEVDGHPAFLVDLTGESMTPAASSAPNLTEAAQAGSSATAAAAPQYEVPEGWVAGRTSAFRVAAFDIRRDGQQAELTVIPLGPASGSLLDNVNRWRGQIGLGTIDQAELDATVKTLTVDGIESSFVELAPADGSDQDSMILAVVIPRPGQTVFVKLLGNRQLVAEERPSFERFVQSLHFPATP
jgi:hypothetical protein